MEDLLETIEADGDDMFVVIVGDNENEVDEIPLPTPSTPIKVDNLISTAKEIGEFVPGNVKEECEEKPDYISDTFFEVDLKNEITIKKESCTSGSEHGYSSDEENNVHDVKDFIPRDRKYGNRDKMIKPSHYYYRKTLLKPHEYRSHIDEVRKLYPELEEDEDLLVDVIAELMRNTKIPEPPADFCIEQGSLRLCTYCDIESPSLASAVRHYLEKHGPRYLVCYACGYDFKSTTILYKHENRCRAPDADILKKARERSMGNKTRAKPFEQFYTKEKSTGAQDKSQKIKSSGITPPLKSFPCKECSAVFTNKSNLDSHENLHKGQRPYRCPECPNAYTSRYSYTRHKKCHSNVEYVCDHCGRTFKFRSLLISHMETHQQLRKFVCEHCGKRFRQKGARNHHVNTVHKKIPPPCACQVCGKRYPRMSLLKVHMRKNHGLLLMTREMFVKALPTMSDIQVQQAARVVLKSEVQQVETVAEVRASNTQKEENVELS